MHSELPELSTSRGREDGIVAMLDYIKPKERERDSSKYMTFQQYRRLKILPPAYSLKKEIMVASVPLFVCLFLHFC